ncbi:protein SULFUR DEFICIENCY-INDUCED 1-like [Carya illinoinensis]|uniref:protein SULFUR DEFICIENCY-INDUCED 1-like n=1 Tax=Carya illinoinensis TaxID=32201 RepID=UPI001C7296B6|nr:protein SULFUR DEFICIENCY-INDUCED 1-like [Carya illinoinensis]
MSEQHVVSLKEGKQHAVLIHFKGNNMSEQQHLVEKDSEAAIVLFWKAIYAGDRVESALKDMAVVMKQLDRTEEAIEAIKSFKGHCSKQAQESLDNVLIDLYKKCGKIEEQIDLIKRKLRLIYQGEAFNGKPTKTARSHGKKFQVSITQETSRLLGNLGWAYMKKSNFMMAEVVYQKAQMINPDANKACNLVFCLIKLARYDEAFSIIQDVLQGRLPDSNECKSRKRAQELIMELKSRCHPSLPLMESSDDHDHIVVPGLDDDFIKGLEQLMNEWGPLRSKRLPIFEEISPFS